MGGWCFQLPEELSGGAGMSDVRTEASGDLDLFFNGDDGTPATAEQVAESRRRIAEAEAAGDAVPSWGAI